MADGGFSVAGRENQQELLSRRLFLCQSAAALGALHAGGVFVCKLFDAFLPFTVQVRCACWRLVLWCRLVCLCA